MDRNTDRSIAITIENISKRYGRQQVFKDFSLEFPANRVIGLLGENGIGKTTLLKMIADIAKPDKGMIKIRLPNAGKPNLPNQNQSQTVNGAMSSNNMLPVSRHTRDLVSYLIDPSRFEDYMKVSDMLRCYQDFHPDFDKAKAEKLCESFHISLKDKIGKLSKGNQERVCLMLCLSRQAPIYLLDEPMAGFDPKFKKELVQVILSHVEEWQTLIISSHLLRDLETLFDEIVILTENGVTVANVEDVREQGKFLEDYYLEVVE